MMGYRFTDRQDGIGSQPDKKPSVHGLTRKNPWVFTEGIIGNMESITRRHPTSVRKQTRRHRHLASSDLLLDRLVAILASSASSSGIDSWHRLLDVTTGHEQLGTDNNWAWWIENWWSLTTPSWSRRTGGMNYWA